MTLSLPNSRAGLTAALLLCLVNTVCHAHKMAPVLITISQQNSTEYRAVWSFSRDEGTVNTTDLSLAFSPVCQLSTGVKLTVDGNRWIREEYFDCDAEPDVTHAIEVQGLHLVDTSIAVRFINEAGNEQIKVLDEHSGTLTLSREDVSDSVFIQYLYWGVQHILAGADHVLFVVALCFLAGGALRKLIGLITAFTVSHSITLSAAALGWVNLSTRPVEALIALSIALVAADLVKNTQHSHRITVNYWPIVFVFGLLHGLGFAGALSEYGLPQAAMLKALLAFNLGVEMGQLCLVLACTLFIGIVHKFKEPGWLNPIVGLGIGCTAGFWFVACVA